MPLQGALGQRSLAGRGSGEYLWLWSLVASLINHLMMVAFGIYIVSTEKLARIRIVFEAVLKLVILHPYI